MGVIAVQGIVAEANGLPFVQFQQLDEQDQQTWHMQLTPLDAREFALKTVEASMNAVYDAALVSWAKETYPEDPNMGAKMLMIIREFRSDIWGLPSQPKDWRHD